MRRISKFDFADRSGEDSPEERSEANRETASLAGLAVALFVVVAGLFVIQELQLNIARENCHLSGQRSCAIIARH